jgi:malonyl CoA-acyl carrier protein transacylase
MTTWVFPGQGSQKLGMGEGLFEKFPHITNDADSVLGYSIKELCLQDPKEQLGNTAYTQPALYTVNALMYYDKLESGVKPAFLAGHSLGEYNALLAAGAFDFKTGLTLVKKRGELMSKAQGGGMAAVIGLTVDVIKTVLADNGLSGVELANFNSPTQIVVSGVQHEVEKSCDLFKQAGARLVVPLKVSGAFHSSLMKPARDEFSAFLSTFTFSSLHTPVISNVEAKPYTDNAVQRLLSEQITSSVRWVDSIEYMLQQGQTSFEEVGPGKVLAGLINAIQKQWSEAQLSH